MVAPTIVLRFRDTTPDVDTIGEHRAIVGRAGHVCWGWWKKAFEEEDPTAVSRRIADMGGANIMLIDTTSERAFLSRCERFVMPNDVPRELVPNYYVDNLQDTAGAFVLGAIADVEYDRDLAARIGEQTLLWTADPADPAFGHRADPVDAGDRDCVLHISDLHFGHEYAFKYQGQDLEIGDERRTLTECLVADIERLGLLDKIGVVIVTGDFVSRGAWGESRQSILDEFEALRAAFRLERNQVVAIPGNHDIIRFSDAEGMSVTQNTVDKQTNYDHELPFRHFVHDLIGRDVKSSLNYIRRFRLRDVDLDVCMMNSCTITATKWTEYGYVGRHGMDALNALIGEPLERRTFRFAALHHHLLPVADVEAPHEHGVSLALDAARILAAAQAAGVNIILHGHQHRPKIASYNALSLNQAPAGRPVHVVANGSAGVSQERLPGGGRNTYCLFRLRDDRPRVWVRELRVDGEPGALLFDGELDSAPLQ